MSDFRDTHPAKIAPKSNLWFGKEVEGRDCGLYTAFIAAPLSSGERGTVLVEIANTLQQVFLTETFAGDSYTASERARHWLWFTREILPHCINGVVVTVGRMPWQLPEFFELPEEWVEQMTLIVRVFDSPWIEKLRLGDQISVGVPYRLVTFDMSEGVYTTPDRYKGDKT